MIAMKPLGLPFAQTFFVRPFKYEQDETDDSYSVHSFILHLHWFSSFCRMIGKKEEFRLISRLFERQPL